MNRREFLKITLLGAALAPVPGFPASMVAAGLTKKLAPIWTASKGLELAILDAITGDVIGSTPITAIAASQGAISLGPATIYAPKACTIREFLILRDGEEILRGDLETGGAGNVSQGARVTTNISISAEGPIGAMMTESLLSRMVE